MMTLEGALKSFVTTTLLACPRDIQLAKNHLWNVHAVSVIPLFT